MMKRTDYGYNSHAGELCDRDLEHWLSEKRKQERLKKRKSERGDQNGFNKKE